MTGSKSKDADSAEIRNQSSWRPVDGRKVPPATTDYIYRATSTSMRVKGKLDPSVSTHDSVIDDRVRAVSSKNPRSMAESPNVARLTGVTP